MMVDSAGGEDSSHGECELERHVLERVRPETSDEQELALLGLHRWLQQTHATTADVSQRELHQIETCIERVKRHDYMASYLSTYVAALERGEHDKLKEGAEEEQLQSLKDMAKMTLERLTSRDAAPPTGIYGEMPPAFGKTFILTQLAKAVGVGTEPRAGSRRIRMLVIVPGPEPVGRMIGADGMKGFGKFMPHLKVREQLGQSQDIGSDVDVMRVETFMRRYKKRLINLDNYDILAVDEAHRILSDMRQEVFSEVARRLFTVGFTGSPEFNDIKNVEKVLPNSFYRMDLRTGVDIGILNSVAYRAFKSGAVIKVQDYDRPDFSERELAALITNSERNQHILDLVQDKVERGLQGWVRCIKGDTSRHARLLEGLGKERMVKDPKTGEMRLLRIVAVGRFTKNLPELQRLYEEGKIDAFASVVLLTESWDSERVGFLIDGASTTSKVRLIQSLGRVLRTAKGKLPSEVDQILDEVRGGFKRVLTYLQILDIDNDEFTQGMIIGPWRGGTKKYYQKRSEFERQKKEQLEQGWHLARELLVGNVTALPEPPENMVHIAELLALTTRTAPTVRHMLERAGLLPVLAKNPKGNAAYYFPVEARKRLPELLAEQQFAEPGMRSATTVIEELNISRPRLRTLMGTLGISAQELLHPITATKATYFTEDEFNALKGEVRGLPIATPRDRLFVALRDEAGISLKTLYEFLKLNNMQTSRKQHPTRGTAHDYIDAADAEEICKFYSPPDTFLIGEIAQAAGISTPEAQRIANKYDLPVILPKGRFINPQKIMKNRYSRSSREVIIRAAGQGSGIPENWFSFHELSVELGESVRYLEKIAKREGIALLQPPDNKSITFYVDEEGRRELISKVPKLVVAGTGDLTMDELKDLVGHSDSWIYTHMPDRLRLTRTRMLKPGQKQAAPHYPIATVVEFLQQIDMKVPKSISQAFEERQFKKTGAQGTNNTATAKAKAATVVVADLVSLDSLVERAAELGANMRANEVQKLLQSKGLLPINVQVGNDVSHKYTRSALQYLEQHAQNVRPKTAKMLARLHKVSLSEVTLTLQGIRQYTNPPVTPAGGSEPFYDEMTQILLANRLYLHAPIPYTLPSAASFAQRLKISEDALIYMLHVNGFSKAIVPMNTPSGKIEPYIEPNMYHYLTKIWKDAVPVGLGWVTIWYLAQRLDCTEQELNRIVPSLGLGNNQMRWMRTVEDFSVILRHYKFSDIEVPLRRALFKLRNQ